MAGHSRAGERVLRRRRRGPGEPRSPRGRLTGGASRPILGEARNEGPTLNPASRPLRILVSLAIALPLGQGGLCCCLVGDHDTAAAVAAAREAAPRSCCTPAGPDGPRDRAPSPDRDDCGCPQRESAILAAAPAESAAAAPVADAAFLAPSAAPAGPTADLLHARFRDESPAPVPKVPRYRTLCVLLC